MDIFDRKNLRPMLISEMREPFDSSEFFYELKFDGIRCLAYLGDGQTVLQNKRGMNLIHTAPELSNMHRAVKGKCILDGELIILRDGKPDFFEVQKRVMMTDAFKIKLASSYYPASFVAFDLLYQNGNLLTARPLYDRKDRLRNAVSSSERIAVSQFMVEAGVALFEQTRRLGLEGVVAKRLNSKYYFGRRTRDWIKFKHLQDEEFLVCGYLRKSKGTTSIVLGKREGDSIQYKGHATLGVGHTAMQQLNRIPKAERHPFAATPPGNEKAIWLEPTLRCTVQYMPSDKNGLRQPVFKGFRSD